MAPAVDYTAIKATLYSWVETVIGSYLQNDAEGYPYIFWTDEAHDYNIAPYAALTLTDGYDYDPVTDTLAPRITGNRQLIFACEIRDRSSANRPRDAAEDLRTALEHEVYMQQLHDGGIAIIGIENFQPSIDTQQERSEALAVIEIRIHVKADLFNANVNVPPVNNVGLTQQLRDCTGALIDPDAVEEMVRDMIYVGAEAVVLDSQGVTL